MFALYKMLFVYNVHCALYNVHCALHNVHCTMYNVLIMQKVHKVVIMVAQSYDLLELQYNHLASLLTQLQLHSF